MSVLLRLFGLSLRGRLIRAARQLRQPKYLAGFAIGSGWILFWLSSWLRDSEVRNILFSGIQEHLVGELGGLLQTVVAIVLAVGFSFGWFVPLGRLALPIRESELHLLLPAPLSRRRIIQYALVKGQVPIVLTSLVFSIMLCSGRAGAFLRAFVALWLALTVWELHAKMRALFFLRQRELSRGAARGRLLAVLGPLAVCWVVLAPRIHAFGRQVYEAVRGVAASQDAGLAELVAALRGLELGAVGLAMVAPFRWLTAPLFTEGTLPYLIALVPGAVMLVALHEAVTRSRARFEETALAHARREADKKSPTRRFTRLSAGKRRRHPFRLAAVGRPEAAVLWKNLLQAGRFRLSRVLLASVAVAAGGAVIPALLRVPQVVFGIEAAIGAWFLVLAPLFIPMGRRNDLRTELRHLELARTWPLTGNRLVLAEVLSPAVIGWIAALFGAALLAAGYYGARLETVLMGVRNETVLLPPASAETFGQSIDVVFAFVLAGALPVAMGVSTIVSAVQNLAALLFPAWIGLGPTAARGMSAMGYQLLFASGVGLVLLIGVVPGAILVGLAVLLQTLVGWPWSVVGFPIWGVLLALPLYAEALLVVRAGGRLWDRLDPSREILETGR